jgi:hypothetical protein
MSENGWTSKMMIMRISPAQKGHMQMQHVWLNLFGFSRNAWEITSSTVRSRTGCL